MKDLYDIVLRAHLAGRAAIRSGVPCQEIDRAARKVIAQAGYGPHFMHRTGHGIGLRGHEEPYIIEGNELPLAPGHCFSVEPGIYMPGRFGVRIENCVSSGSVSRAQRTGELRGCLLPSFGPWLILATVREAGEALLRFKHTTAETRTVIPEENEDALSFLHIQGLAEVATVPRMLLGSAQDWRPTQVWSRAVGYCG